MDELVPKSSCSKDLTDCFVLKNHVDATVKSNSLKYEEENEINAIMPLPMLPLRRENILNNYSDYEIYDDNNNCMLTNLNQFGLTYFNINSNDDTVEEYINDDIHLDCTPDGNQVFEGLTKNVNDVNSNKAKLKATDSDLINNINILNLDEIKNPRIIHENNMVNYQNVLQQNFGNENKCVTSDQWEEYTDIQDYYNNCPEWLKLIHNDIEQVLKCNIITKVCVADTGNKIANNDSEDKMNINKLPKTVLKCVNEEVKHNIDYNNINIIETKSKDCLQANNREIEHTTTNSGDQSEDSDACSYHSSDFEFIDEEEASKECKLNIAQTDFVENNAKEFDDNFIIKDYFSRPNTFDSTSIPSGDDYHNLFLERNFESINNEHKAISSIKGMEVSSGPDMDLNFIVADAKYKKEADDSIQIILSMYPKENSAHCTFSKK